MSGEICGGSVVLQIKDNAGSPTFQTVGGLKTRSIQMNAESVDITNADSAGWRELLDACGTNSVQVSGDGIFKDNASMEEVREAFFARSIRDWKLTMSPFGDFAGKFKITALTIAAEHNAAATFSMTLESAGEVTFTATV